MKEANTAIKLQVDTPYGHQMRILERNPFYVIQVKFNEDHEWEDLWVDPTYHGAFTVMYEYFLGMV